MSAEEFARLRQLVSQVDGKAGTAFLLGNVTLAIEWNRLNNTAESDQALERALANVAEIPLLATTARQFLASDNATLSIVTQILNRGFKIELESNFEGNDLIFAISAFRNTVRSKGRTSLELMNSFIQLQSQHVAGASPEMQFSDSRSNETRRAYRSFRKPAFVLPDRSSLLSTSLRAAIVDSPQDELRELAFGENASASTNSAEVAVRNFVSSVAYVLMEDWESAKERLARAKAANVAAEVIQLYEVWLMAAHQRYDEARLVLDAVQPSNEGLQRECELWKMDIATKLGNFEEARRAARVLSKLPLSVQENAEVAAALSK